MKERSETYRRIYAAVRRVPRGKVATYGQIARAAGLAGGARQVGYALHALDDRAEGEGDVPWHRVINSRGTISARSEPVYERIQRRLLEDEGVVFEAGGRVSLARFRWQQGQSAV